ncbi:hypothetical protein [Nonomuraea guangzhouensis]|uniref:Uncharacterized protein n=1 Tax=Nonomuraea guangzhouensis TaxID=1291555 RepID=A0ABW4G746_9ACTN|nr:hypothetical protein [Nonomuraea guangzhouensis]
MSLAEHARVLQAEANDVWKVDMTFWLHVVERPHVPDALRLRAATDGQRLTILRLKHECPHYPDTIGGADICTAVLERGVRTVEELLEGSSFCRCRRS